MMMMMKCYAAFGLFLSITVTIQSQLTVIWQGVPVTGPLLIYHSEIQRTVNSNSLTCRHPTGPVAWYLTVGNTRLTTESFGTFINVITNEGRQAEIMRGPNDRYESLLDGLWTCRLNGATGAGAFHVGIYDDTPTTRNGSITTVRGQAFFYISNPPSFQLVGDSTGGPPTTNYWTRNGINITNNSTFNISISFTGPHDDAGHRAANYTSTLTVTGRQPGVYQYHVSNRRTNGTRSSRNITIEDLLAPTIFSMSLLTSTSVNISWTQPMGGLVVDIYRVTLTGMCPGLSHTREETTTSTSIVIDDLDENSIYTVTISAVNNEFNAINTTSGPTITTVPSGPPVIAMPPTVSSRSITVNWNEIPCIQHNGRITRYEVEFIPSGEGTISGRSFTANGLTPFTNYTFRVRRVNSEGPGPYSDLITITTSEAAPGPVLSLMGTSTLTTVVLTWSLPQQHNGIITQYMVTYRVNGSAPVTRDINDPDTTTFTIPSLFPQTTISNISVRASTSAGPGPEMTLENVVTLTRPSEVMGVDVEIVTDTSVRVSWERILNIPEITHYTVFYSRAGSRKRQAAGEQSKTVPSTEDSVVIRNLNGGARSYQFVVVAAAIVDNNMEILGERPANPFMFPSSASDGDVCSGDVVLTFILTFLLTIILHTIVMLGTCYIYRVCYANRTKSITKQTEKGNTAVITTKVDSHDFAMKKCTAYGPVQAQYEEGTYENV